MSANATRRVLASPGDIILSGSTTFTGLIKVEGEIAPPAINANTNDYAPPGIESANILRLSATAGGGAFNLTGIQAPSPADSRWLQIIHVAGKDVLIKNQDVSSLAANRFFMQGDPRLSVGDSLWFRYSVTDSRWVGVNLDQ